MNDYIEKTTIKNMVTTAETSTGTGAVITAELLKVATLHL